MGEEDATAMSRLANWAGLPAAEDRVVIAWRTLEVSSWAAARLHGGEPGGQAGGDSGWYLGPVDRPEATGGYRATTVGSLLEALPWLAGVLGLDAGAVVVVNAGTVAAVLDERDRDVWASGH